MKKIAVLFVFLLSLFLLLPLTALTKAPTVSQANAVTPGAIKKNDNIKVLLSETNDIVTLSAQDYIFGVIAGEMPALYETEALKAQAVCAYTFLMWRKSGNSDKDYDITDNYKVDQCYIPKEKALENWGSKAREYEKKISDAVKSVKGELLTYDGKIILSVYHAVSGGTTESAKNVWGKDYPYLQPVSSIGDKLATNYISTYKADKQKIENAFAVTLPDNPKDAFTDIKRTNSGTVKTVKIGDKSFKGSEVREKLGLKSANFEIEIKDGEFLFTVYGYGHGVGLSQNGANYMAQQGSDYKEILCHYYKGCKIE